MYQLYDIILEALSLVKSELPAQKIRNLWDHYIKSTWEATEDIEEVCDCLKTLGPRLNHREKYFPKAHVIFRLETLLLGTWPYDAGIRRPSQDDKMLTLQAILSALGGSWTNVLNAYLDVLDSKIMKVPSWQGLPQLHIEVLKSLLVVFEQISADPFFTSSSGEMLTGQAVVAGLDKCVQAAQNLKDSTLQTEVDTLLVRFKDARCIIHGKVYR